LALGEDLIAMKFLKLRRKRLYILTGNGKQQPEHRKPRYTLDELVNQITEENRHREFNMGKHVGKEII
jgi:antitoxin component of MazEF toxin-antitoxin module